MKVLKSHQINPFGGLNFVIEELDNLKIDSFFARELPELPKQCSYSWRDLIYSFWSVFFCGGDCAEDLSRNLNKDIVNHPNLTFPSPDRVLNRMKELSVPSITCTTPRGQSMHQISFNHQINRLNIKLIKHLWLKNKKPIILDYDNTLLFTKKADAKSTFKHGFGYAPGVGIIDNQIAYVENRNGNSAPQNLQEETLERMFRLMENEGIKTDVFRADGASFHLASLEIIDKYAKNFFIKARMSHQLHEAISKVKHWSEVSVEGETILRGSINITPFASIAKRKKIQGFNKVCRLVVSKVKRNDGQLNIFTNEAYNYHTILTNDFAMSDDQVVHFYNQRGAIEKEFDVLKNDFGWNKMPFSKLEQNTVFLIMTAMCRNIYSYIIKKFASLYQGLSPHFRIKKFIFRFICKPAKWVKKSRKWHLRIYGDLAFKT